jgi:hypothetical protein
MPEIDPRVLRIRQIGVVVFLVAAGVSVPLGIHITRTSRTPELGLTLLGAVLLLVLISLFALETAMTRIPEPRYTQADADGRDLDPTEFIEAEQHLTELLEPEPHPTELVEPGPALALAETRLSDTELDEGKQT